ncbi:hypothetical protein BMF94_3870 [Rhodotorula taiwanensis]|uniref:Transcription factor domain-containing protein n=1 Tax=Rhodotorula taiwanensis TaxID=741276 RepID=A0A2S5B8C8_9BASI|nr:hypothetical protein BMF94_3870 [Rhodotorula taiwanensis]
MTLTKRSRRSRAVCVDAAHDLNQRQASALDELRLFRTTLDSLKARLPALEYFVANSSLKEEDEDAELDRIVRSFGDPVTTIAADEGSVAGDQQTASEPSSKRPRTSLGGGGNQNVLHALANKGKGKQKQEADEGEAGVEASVNLEFYALGRPRVWAEPHLSTSAVTEDADMIGGAAAGPSSSPSHRNAVLPSVPEGQPESPVSLFPNGEALRYAAPTRVQEEIILQQGVDVYGFHHAVVYGSDFHAQVSAFQDLGEDRFDRASLAWLSAYFALLAVSAKLVTPAQQDQIGLTEGEMSACASRWFLCSISCLYRHNFLQNHDLACLQAIAILVLSGRDAGSATLIASLLHAGLSIAQDLGLHRLVSDDQWDQALRDKPRRIRAKSLIDREIRKRVMFSLAHSDWFAIPYRTYSTLTRAQITTPLPLNATDGDLARGELVNRPRNTYTPAAWLLQYIEIGASMASAFESSRTDKATAAQAYQRFLQADKELESLLQNLPLWLQQGAPSDGMPPCVQAMRTTFIISLEHKILSIHRPFLARPSRATTYALSRKRVIEAARAILREAPQARDIRLWTAIYHISVASFSLTLELYEQLKSPSADNQAIRNEIQQALPTLEGLKAASAIAERGLGLVTPLLADEKRMREEGGSFRQKDRRKTKPAPTRTKSGAITQAAPPGVSPGQSTTATTQAPLASPAASLDLLVNNEAAASAASVSPSMEPPFYPFAHAGSYDSFAAGNLPPHLFGSTGGAYPPHPLQIPPWMFHEHYLQSHLSGGDDGVSTVPSPFPATQLGWPNGPMTGALGMGLSVGLQHAPFAWDWPAQGDSGMTENATPNAA